MGSGKNSWGRGGVIVLINDNFYAPPISSIFVDSPQLKVKMSTPSLHNLFFNRLPQRCFLIFIFNVTHSPEVIIIVGLSPMILLPLVIISHWSLYPNMCKSAAQNGDLAMKNGVTGPLSHWQTNMTFRSSGHWQWRSTYQQYDLWVSLFL